MKNLCLAFILSFFTLSLYADDLNEVVNEVRREGAKAEARARAQNSGEKFTKAELIDSIAVNLKDPKTRSDTLFHIVERDLKPARPQIRKEKIAFMEEAGYFSLMTDMLGQDSADAQRMIELYGMILQTEAKAKTLEEIGHALNKMNQDPAVQVMQKIEYADKLLTILKQDPSPSPEKRQLVMDELTALVQKGIGPASTFVDSSSVTYTLDIIEKNLDLFKQNDVLFIPALKIVAQRARSKNRERAERLLTLFPAEVAESSELSEEDQGRKAIPLPLENSFPTRPTGPSGQKQ